MNFCDVWSVVIDRLRVRLSSWKAKALSIGGRLTLIQSVLDNSRGISWVKWSSILYSRKMRSLGVGSLQAKNLGLLGKWKWRFLTEKDALWRKVIKDKWCEDDTCLKDRFARLYALELNQDCFIKGRWRLVNGSWSSNWDWRAPPRGRSLAEFSSLLSIIGGVNLDGNGDDKWSWDKDASDLLRLRLLWVVRYSSVRSQYRATSYVELMDSS
nr:RNA-directed DNA polymerase, eukaryota, reverse transcriptase zinc-binding domain protein [Tanacetum cinerariifolium]